MRFLKWLGCIVALFVLVFFVAPICYGFFWAERSVAVPNVITNPSREKYESIMSDYFRSVATYGDYENAARFVKDIESVQIHDVLNTTVIFRHFYDVKTIRRVEYCATDSEGEQYYVLLVFESVFFSTKIGGLKISDEEGCAVDSVQTGRHNKTEFTSPSGATPMATNRMTEGVQNSVSENRS